MLYFVFQIYMSLMSLPHEVARSLPQSTSRNIARDSYDKSSKYIDFKINGRLFPSWVVQNFKKYKLPSITRKEGEDPCKESTGETKKELRKYQLFLKSYMDFQSPYRDILIYHGLGSGKTNTAINIYNSLYNYTPGWNMFLLIKASLRGGWQKELETWLQKDQYEYRYRNIIFINYDSPTADRKFMDAIKNVDSSKKSIYIIDEVHNFIRNVYSNISSDKGKRAQNIYDYIIQDKKENRDTRVILLSGTPAINKPFELALLFNLLRPGSMPKSENEFNHLFITSTSYQTLNKNNKNLFQRRIMGLVSYYIGATPDRYATKTTYYVDVPMSGYHEDIYNIFEDIEEKIAIKAKFKGGSSTTYKTYTRQACNFVFPQISQKLNGENRPRPNKYRLSEREAEKLSEGQALKGSKENLVHISEYMKATEFYIHGFDAYLSEKSTDDAKKGYTIQDDLQTLIKKYDGNYEKFFAEETKKSSLFQAMYTSSSKMTYMLFNIMKSKGLAIVYSNYVLMEGLEIFKIYLKYFNFYSYTVVKKYLENKVGYVEFHGGIPFEERFAGLEAFNKSDNRNGELIKIILISPAGSEGLNLSNIRHIHIMEPYWNEVRINQLIGRGVRQCSHVDLPMDERHVDIYRYRSTRQTMEKWTTDQYIEDLARSKDSLIQSFLDAMKEVAIDCVLNKDVNMMESEYKCFQFEEKSLFDKYVGPSYKEYIADDLKIDNGSNSNKAITQKIRVLKIQAVKILSPPDEEPVKYSEPQFYWYYDKSGIVYDFDVHMPIGRVAKDMDNLPVKIDKNTYIIDYVIPIPEIST